MRSSSLQGSADQQLPGLPAPPHAVQAEEVLVELGSAETGLSSNEASDRLARFGPNALPAGARRTLVLLWRQINSPLIWVLLASGAVAMAADWHGDGIKNGLVIFAVIVVNSVIGFVQEFRAGRAIESLTRMMPESIAVTRDGRRYSIPVAGVVPGDVVHMASGDRVPADARLLSARGLAIEEAALTGESVPTQKTPTPVAPDAVLGDRTCMVYAGTLVTTGVGTAVVLGTGANTEPRTHLVADSGSDGDRHAHDEGSARSVCGSRSESSSLRP